MFFGVFLEEDQPLSPLEFVGDALLPTLLNSQNVAFVEGGEDLDGAVVVLVELHVELADEGALDGRVGQDEFGAGVVQVVGTGYGVGGGGGHYSDWGMGGSFIIITSTMIFRSRLDAQSPRLSNLSESK